VMWRPNKDSKFQLGRPVRYVFVEEAETE
jgi:hypothetical protein